MESRNYYILLDPGTFKEQISKDNSVQLLDVRTPLEYNKGHIKGAMNASYLGFSFKKKVKELDRDLPVYIYCQTAHRSPLAAKSMRKMGFKKVYDLESGFKAWKADGLPVELE